VLLPGHEGAIWSAAVMTERACTFTASEDKTVRMWKAGKCECVFHGQYRVLHFLTAVLLIVRKRTKCKHQKTSPCHI